MYEDKQIMKRSVPVFIFLFLIMGGLSLLTKDMSYGLGLVLGYGLNLIIFKIITLSVDHMLLFRGNISMVIVMLSHLAKLAVYSFGFYLSVKNPSIFNIFTVTLGYFVLKLSIFYCDNRMRKRGEGM